MDQPVNGVEFVTDLLHAVTVVQGFNTLVYGFGCFVRILQDETNVAGLDSVDLGVNHKFCLKR